MTYLIQNTRTGEYFHAGNWTSNSGRAEEFPNSHQALVACLNYELHELALVLQFGFESGRNYKLHLAFPETVLRLQGELKWRPLF